MPARLALTPPHATIAGRLSPGYHFIPLFAAPCIKMIRDRMPGFRFSRE